MFASVKWFYGKDEDIYDILEAEFYAPNRWVWAVEEEVSCLNTREWRDANV